MSDKPKNKRRPKTIDEYLAALPSHQRAALERLRKIVHATVPGAEECISYDLPTFRLNGKAFFCFGAWTDHCAIYGHVGPFEKELKNYDTSKGTIRFRPDKPLPAALIKKLVKARVVKITERKQKARRLQGTKP